VPADELLRIGYLDALAPAAELDTLMHNFTQALEAGAPLALRGMKLSLNEIGRGEFDLKRLRLREARCAVSDDLREGLAAFAERREPRFTGR
jgi:enoyl-CoA hydratase